MNKLLKISLVTFVVAMPFALSCIVTSNFNIVDTAYAGPGGGKGGGGGGSSGGRGGGNKGGPSKGDLYGDMLYLDRNIDGVPYVDDNGCLRPIYPFNDPVLLIPLVGGTAGADGPFAACEPQPLSLSESEVSTEDDELDVCDIRPDCLYLAREVELGRLSVIRAPERVLDRQRDEAIKVINSSDEVVLDAGGRLVPDSVPFDSPLINLALFRDFLLHGGLFDKDDSEVWVPPESLHFDYTPVQAAAFGLAAGDDKLGNRVDVEVVARTAKMLNLAEDTGYHEMMPSLYGPVSYGASPSYGEEVFINFREFGKSSPYSRAATYPGDVCYFVLDEGYYEKTIIDAVFDGNLEPTSLLDRQNIAGFAQAAEDARNVITFVHDPGDVLQKPALLIWADSAYENEVDLDCGPPE